MCRKEMIKLKVEGKMKKCSKIKRYGRGVETNIV
jgi:hypothetical protein